MRILDAQGKELLAPDYSKGYTREEKLLVAHYDAVEATPDVGHYETAKVYPSGGRDVVWVVDIPGTEAREAYDEYEQILRYVPFTELEMLWHRLRDLKKKLSDSDFQILKIVEGASTLQECSTVIRNRALWRKEVNELQKQLDQLSNN